MTCVLLGYDLRGRLGVNSYQESTNRVCFQPVEELPLVGVWERGSVGVWECGDGVSCRTLAEEDVNFCVRGAPPRRQAQILHNLIRVINLIMMEKL